MRAENLIGRKPELIADLWLYPTDLGGRTKPVGLGWSCPCTISQSKGTGLIGYDGCPLLGEELLAPGGKRRVGFVFLSGAEAVAALKPLGRFFLWEMRIIGEATIVPDTIA